MDDLTSTRKLLVPRSQPISLLSSHLLPAGPNHHSTFKKFLLTTYIYFLYYSYKQGGNGKSVVFLQNYTIWSQPEPSCKAIILLFICKLILSIFFTIIISWRPSSLFFFFLLFLSILCFSSPGFFKLFSSKILNARQHSIMERQALESGLDSNLDSATLELLELW